MMMMDLVVNLAALFCEKTKHHKIIHIPKKVNVSNIDGAKDILLEKKSIQKLNELFQWDLDLFHYKKIIVYQ